MQLKVGLHTVRVERDPHEPNLLWCCHVGRITYSPDGKALKLPTELSWFYYKGPQSFTLHFYHIVQKYFGITKTDWVETPERVALWVDLTLNPE